VDEVQDALQGQAPEHAEPVDVPELHLCGGEGSRGEWGKW
jgi:hypothetical protein